MAWGGGRFYSAQTKSGKGFIHGILGCYRKMNAGDEDPDIPCLPRARLTPRSGAFGTTMWHCIAGLTERRVVTVVSRARACGNGPKEAAPGILRLEKPKKLTSKKTVCPYTWSSYLSYVVQVLVWVFFSAVSILWIRFYRSNSLSNLFSSSIKVQFSSTGGSFTCSHIIARVSGEPTAMCAKKRCKTFVETTVSSEYCTNLSFRYFAHIGSFDFDAPFITL